MEESKSKNYYCIVPMCTSTSKNNPNKEFIRVPRDLKRRKIWMLSIRRNPSDISDKTSSVVCEDHFILEEDLENYMEWKLVGARKRLKPNVVPHRFDCQINRSVKHSKPERSVVTKRRRLEMIQDLVKPSTSSAVDEEENPIISEELNTHLHMEVQVQPAFEDKSVQVHIRPSFRSKGIQCTLSDIKKVDVSCSPLKDNLSSVTEVDKITLCDNSPSKSSVSSNITCSSDEEMPDSDEKMKKISIERSLYYIEKRSKLYLGLPNDSYFTLKILQKYCKLSLINILIVLKKIKTNHTYKELADDFGCSDSNVSRIFLSSVSKINCYLKKLIIWPSRLKIVQNLPISFRVRNAKVESIINCFEIEIEKPSDPFKQANTVKYLVSSTPDGIINFISGGFGGRASDTTIIEHSGYLESLVPGCAVMADRGFKHIEPLLVEKRCKLLRPPSVLTGSKNSKSDVILTKQIASLRIHIERVVRRIREFNMLKRHSVIDHTLLASIDQIVTIVCGLINLQGPLIK